MCGICGFAVPAGSEERIDESVLVRMRDALVHRGPDDAGIFIDHRAGLGHLEALFGGGSNGARLHLGPC